MTIYNQPEVQEIWNPLVRDYDDREFRFGLTSGLDGPTVVYPATYRLEITPDLGHNSISKHFTEYDGTDGNGLLVIIEGLVAGTDIDLVGDGSGTYSVPLDTMKRVIAPGYPRFLWRVVPVGGDGQDWTASAVQSFRGRVTVHDDSWTVEQPDRVSKSPAVILRGTRSPHIVSIEINDSEVWTTYPSPTTWEASVPLLAGVNTFLLRGFDSKDNSSSYKRVDVELYSSDIHDAAYFNRFDDFGFMLGIERLPEERNQPFKRRVQDVFSHRGGPSYRGILVAATREIGATYDDAAILLRGAVQESGRRRQDVTMWATSSWIYLTTGDSIVRQEYAEIPGNSWRIQPSIVPIVGFLTIEQPIGVEVPKDAWRFEDDWIQFVDPDYVGAPVYLTYRYALRIPLEDSTLQDVVDALNALEVNGSSVVEARLSDRRDGTEDAEGLMAFQSVTLEVSPNLTVGGVQLDEMPLRWTDLKLRPLLEADFVKRFYSGTGHMFGTAYAGYANRLKRELHTTWGYLIADTNVWAGKRIRPSGIGRLPTCYDPEIGRWRHTSDGPSYSAREAWGRGFYSPFDETRLVRSGVGYEMLQSGVGAAGDLVAVVKDHGTMEDDAEESFEIRYTQTTLSPSDVAEFDLS